MSSNIHMQMMGAFVLYVDGQPADRLVNKSRKGVTMIQQLLLSRGRQVANFKLLENLWSDERGANPENALKTLVSRMRLLLNELAPGLGKCIVADRGAYHWECMPGMTVDLYEIDAILDRLGNPSLSAQARTEAVDRLQELYTTDVLAAEEQSAWALGESVRLHDRYAAAIRSHAALLRREGRWEELARVAGRALDALGMDHLIEENLLLAQLHVQGAQDGAEGFSRTARALDSSVDAVMEGLAGRHKQSALLCSFDVFRSIYELQLRCLERSGRPVMLAVFNLLDEAGGTPETSLLDRAAPLVQDALCKGLCDGDVVARHSEAVFTALMPVVGYTEACRRVDRVREHAEKALEGMGVRLSATLTVRRPENLRS